MAGSLQKFHLSSNSMFAIHQITACVKTNDLKPNDEKKTEWAEKFKPFYKRRTESVGRFLFDLGSLFEYHEDIFVFMIILLERSMTVGVLEDLERPITLKYLTSENAYLLPMVAAIIAEKVLNDTPFSNYSYCYRYLDFVTLDELNNLEILFLNKINWAVNVDSKLYDYYAMQLKFPGYPEPVIKFISMIEEKVIEEKVVEEEKQAELEFAEESPEESSEEIEDESVGGEYGYSPSPEISRLSIAPRLEPTGIRPIHKINETLYNPLLFKEPPPNCPSPNEYDLICYHPTSRGFSNS